MQLFSWMCSIPLAMAARSVEVNAASIVYGTTPLGQWYLCKVNIITFFQLFHSRQFGKAIFGLGVKPRLSLSSFKLLLLHDKVFVGGSAGEEGREHHLFRSLVGWRSSELAAEVEVGWAQGTTRV